VALNRQANKSFLSKSPELSKSFWKSVKPFFKNVKQKKGFRILLVDNDNIVSNDFLDYGFGLDSLRLFHNNLRG